MKTYKKMFLSSIIAVSMVGSITAAPLQLTGDPLILNQSVPPALAVTFDDSGSMAWSYMPDSRSFSWGRRSFASPDYNLMYYNPAIQYDPPVHSDGTSYPQANFYSAERDGYDTAAFGSVNLSTRYRPFRQYYYYGNSSNNIRYARAGRASNRNRAFYFRWIGPANASINDRLNQNANYELVEIGIGDGVGQEQNFANWYSYYNSRNKLAKAAVSHAFVNFGPDFKVDWQQINNNRFSNSTINLNTFEGSHRENFYDWLFEVPTNGGTPLRAATRRAGEIFTENVSYYDADYGGELTCQQNFHIAISDGSWNGSSGVTGNRDGTSTTLPDSITFNPAGSGSMYTDNNSSSLADTAFYYWANDLNSGLTNNVPTFIDSYTDKDGNTVALTTGQMWTDVPELYWNPNNDPANWQHMVNFNVGLGIEGSFDRETDLPRLRSGELSWPDISGDTCYVRNFDSLGNPVEVETTCQRHACYDSVDDSGNQVDCADGLLVDGDGPIQYCENLGNGNTVTCTDRIVRYVVQSQGRVDDVWHSSINSRGDYFSARNPSELADALYNVVSNILKRKGRSSSGSVSSNIISVDTKSFKTGYDTSDWSGFVVAQEIDGNNGTAGDVLWDAACVLTGGPCPSMSGAMVSASNTHDSRNIFTYIKNPAGLGGTQVDFLGSALSTLEKYEILNSSFYQDVLNNDPLNDPNNVFNADDVIGFIRGDRSMESSQGGVFRNRASLLGDNIHSTAQYLKGNSGGYSDEVWFPGTPEQVAADLNNGYEDFVERMETRNSLLLIGSNDGMLHAFDADDDNSSNVGGHEYWSYMPSKAMNGISELANPTYRHKSFVDTAPVIYDAFVNNVWSTYAVGGMRLGGKLFYALKLNDDATQVPEVLWEFTEQDDPDMGYSYNNATILRVAAPSSTTTLQTKWVALLPNGYNSTNHKSVLYAVDLTTGEMLHKWDTGNGDITNPNGMAAPTGSDYMAYTIADTGLEEGPGLYDQVAEYAYAGDLHGNLYRFDLSEIFGTTLITTPETLYSGSSIRPITTPPRVVKNTVRNVDGSENPEAVVVFGTGKYIELSDRTTVGQADQYLFGIKDDGSPITSPVTFTSTNMVTQTIVTQTITLRELSELPVLPTQHWKLKLDDAGERMVNPLTIVGANLLAVSIIPSGDDPCLAGGYSWALAMDYSTGGKPAEGGYFNNNSVDGMLINDLALGFNVLVSIGGNQQLLTIDVAGDGSNDENVIIETVTSKWKRRSWHRIIID